MLNLITDIIPNIPKITLSKATPIELKDLLLKNGNIPPREIPSIIKKIKSEEKRGNTEETQESLLNSSIQSWNSFYTLKALPQDLKIRILPSESVNFNRVHAMFYYQIITVAQALKLGFYMYNCKCGGELVSHINIGTSSGIRFFSKQL